MAHIRPKIVAHRGSSGHTPENTLVAIQRAIDEQADMVEIDVQLTADEEVVLFHDRTLERVLAKKEAISSYSLDQLMKFDVGLWKGTGFRGLRIPTLAEALYCTRGHSMVVEIKSRETWELLASRVLDIIEQSKGIGKGYISVRNIETLQWFREHTGLKVGLMQKQRSPAELFSLIDTHGLDLVQIRSENFRAADYERLAEYGIETFVYWGDTPQEWEYFTAQGLTGILTNYPGEMRSHFKMIERKEYEGSYPRT